MAETNYVMVTVRMPKRAVEKMDRQVTNGVALNRSDYLRSLITKDVSA